MNIPKPDEMPQNAAPVQRSLFSFSGIHPGPGHARHSGLSHALIYSISLAVVDQYGKVYTDFDIGDAVGTFLRKITENPNLFLLTKLPASPIDELLVASEVRNFIMISRLGCDKAVDDES